jgi:hypothetical protein
VPIFAVSEETVVSVMAVESKVNIESSVNPREYVTSAEVQGLVPPNVKGTNVVTKAVSAI